jgi:hypothetical protein
VLHVISVTNVENSTLPRAYDTLAIMNSQKFLDKSLKRCLRVVPQKYGHAEREKRYF